MRSRKEPSPVSETKKESARTGSFGRLFVLLLNLFDGGFECGIYGFVICAAVICVIEGRFVPVILEIYISACH